MVKIVTVEKQNPVLNLRVWFLVFEKSDIPNFQTGRPDRLSSVWSLWSMQATKARSSSVSWQPACILSRWCIRERITRRETLK